MPIHPTAVVHSSAIVSADADIGPFSLIEAESTLGAGVVIGPRCRVGPRAQIGAGAVLSDGVVVGSPPQDLKYGGEKTRVEIGERTRLREYVTVNAGTAASGTTRVGDDCYVMAYAHIAHDCQVGDGVLIANAVQMGGHVFIGSHAVISGMTGIHQFSTIGAGVFIGGGLRVARDIPPFSKALGDPLTWAGVNSIALEKLGYGRAEIGAVKKMFRLLKERGEKDFLNEIDKSEVDLKNLRGYFKAFFETRSRGLLL